MIDRGDLFDAAEKTNELLRAILDGLEDGDEETIMNAREALNLTQRAIIRARPEVGELVDGALRVIRESAMRGHRQTIDPVEMAGVGRPSGDGPREDESTLFEAYSIIESKGYRVERKQGAPCCYFHEVSW